MRTRVGGHIYEFDGGRGDITGANWSERTEGSIKVIQYYSK